MQEFTQDEREEMLSALKSTEPRKHYGTFQYKNQKLFFKKTSANLFEKEISGAQFIAQHYPTPKIIQTFISESLIIFEHEQTITTNRGLLIDHFSGHEKASEKVTEILRMYARVFKKTLRESSGEESDIYFKRRVFRRLPLFYKPNFLEKKETFVFNGELLSIVPGLFVKEITDFFTRQRTYWCVASQCDPGDLNLGLKPIVLDCTGGGYTPLMAELATLFWYQLAQSEYFSPKYHPEAYVDHGLNLPRKECVSYTISEPENVWHYANPERIEFLRSYILNVIQPLFEEGELYPGWYSEFKAFIGMRILGVFNVSCMDRSDLLCSLGYLAKIFAKEGIRDPLELLNFTGTIYS